MYLVRAYADGVVRKCDVDVDGRDGGEGSGGTGGGDVAGVDESVWEDVKLGEGVDEVDADKDG